MEQFAPVLDVVVICLSLFSIIVLVWGVVVSAKDFFLSRFRTKDSLAKLQQLTEVKNSLGGYVLLSLEILIAADIVDSILKPTLDDIIRLAAIVAIRTVISYFLNKEIRNTHEMRKLNNNQ
ncbi:DUF1622 domain-containing protein [Christensenellaceae bacterium OttesenSCG-928-K19]|nr:DUF1622 domain-containing protein [Christensenellaceae bacterium OttesenSCG-928-K19]